MSSTLNTRIVITIHGIQTQGKWQKNITPYLAKYGLVPYHIDFGWFSVLKFLCPISRGRQLSRIREELRNLVDRVGVRRVSVIAHSFGTFLIMEALIRENGNFTYDRVVLTGSIVPRNFEWKNVFDRHMVMAVRNERATADWVVVLAAFAAHRLRWIFWLKAGDSGRNCFDEKLPALLDDFVDGNHSVTHNALKYEQWARFIAYPHLPLDILEKVKVEMSALRVDAAKILEEQPDNVRINLFAPIGGALRIVPGAYENMTYLPEIEMKIELGHGATGTAFETGNPCIVVKQGDTWSGSSLPGTELSKLNPALRWVISLPVKSTSRNITVGVINVDGLHNLPEMIRNISSEDAEDVVVGLFFAFVPRFQQYLEAAFRGDPLPQMEA